jgi:hypothetical protein
MVSAPVPGLPSPAYGAKSTGCDDQLQTASNAATERARRVYGTSRTLTALKLSYDTSGTVEAFRFRVALTVVATSLPHTSHKRMYGVCP